MIFPFREWSHEAEYKGVEMNFTMSVGEKSRKAKRTKWLMLGKALRLYVSGLIFFFLDNNFIEIQLKYHIVHPIEV